MTLAEALAAAGVDAPSTWPVWRLSQDPAQAQETWARVAAALGVPFVAELRELRHLRAPLSGGWEDERAHLETLRAGIVPTQLLREGTPWERRLGVTFHPALASADVALAAPHVWETLLALVHPFPRWGAEDALLMITRTRDGEGGLNGETVDPLPEHERALLRLQRGVETLSPMGTVIMAEAARLIPEALQRHHGLIPFHLERQELWVMTTDIEQQALFEGFERALKPLKIRVFAMREEDARAYWEHQGAAH